MSERADIEALVMHACHDEGAQAVTDKLELMSPNAAKLGWRVMTGI